MAVGDEDSSEELNSSSWNMLLLKSWVGVAEVDKGVGLKFASHEIQVEIEPASVSLETSSVLDNVGVSTPEVPVAEESTEYT